MSAFFEFEGKTIKAAIKKASQELNIKEEQIDHDVLSYGSTGIFGLVGAKKARIRVTVSAKKFRKENHADESTESINRKTETDKTIEKKRNT